MENFKKMLESKPSLGKMAFENYLKSNDSLEVRRKACILQEYQHDIMEAIEEGKPIPLLRNAEWLDDIHDIDIAIVWDPFKKWTNDNDLKVFFSTYGKNREKVLEVKPSETAYREKEPDIISSFFKL